MSKAKELIEAVVNGGQPRSIINEARELTPAQKNLIKALEARIGFVKKHLASAESSLKKWLQDKRFDPQKDNLVSELKQASQAAKSAMFQVERL